MFIRVHPDSSGMSTVSRSFRPDMAAASISTSCYDGGLSVALAMIQPCIPDPRGRRQSQDFVASAVDGVPAIPGRAGPAAGAAAFPG